MPGGGSSGGHSSGHFSGGSFSHSSGHFSSGSFSRSSGHFGGSSSYVGSRSSYRPWYGPRVVVFGGRRVYLNSGRASAVSVLGTLIIIAIIVTAVLGFGWSGAESDLKTMRATYSDYRAMAQKAYDDPTLQVEATVYEIEEFKYTGRFCINYRFKTTDGSTLKHFSFFVYSRAEAEEIYNHGEGKIMVGLNSKNTLITSVTDSVPLDYRNMDFEADEEYVEKVNERNGLRIAMPIAAVVLVLLIVSDILIQATAAKATAEQIAAEKNGSSTSTESSSQSTPAGMWRCAYCGTLNDNAKERCEGCGAMRQK